MQETVFSTNDSSISIWKEVRGQKSGDALVNRLKFKQSVSLTETFQEMVIPQIGYDTDEVMIVRKGYIFQVDFSASLSKAEYGSISNRSMRYQIEVVISGDVTYILKTCIPIGNWTIFSGSDNQIMKSAAEYRVQSYS